MFELIKLKFRLFNLFVCIFFKSYMKFTSRIKIYLRTTLMYIQPRIYTYAHTKSAAIVPCKSKQHVTKCNYFYTFFLKFFNNRNLRLIFAKCHKLFVKLLFWLICYFLDQTINISRARAIVRANWKKNKFFRLNISWHTNH